MSNPLRGLARGNFPITRSDEEIARDVNFKFTEFVKAFDVKCSTPVAKKLTIEPQPAGTGTRSLADQLALLK